VKKAAKGISIVLGSIIGINMSYFLGSLQVGMNFIQLINTIGVIILVLELFKGELARNANIFLICLLLGVSIGITFNLSIELLLLISTVMIAILAVLFFFKIYKKNDEEKKNNVKESKENNFIE